MESASRPDRPTIDEIVVGDDPQSWRSAGFAVDDNGVAAIGQVRVRLVGRDEGKQILGWSLRGLETAELDGLPTSTSETALPQRGEHPNGCLMIDHVVVLTPDTKRTIAGLEAAGIMALRTRETDTAEMPTLQTFFRAGEVIIELVGPEEPTGDDPATFFGLAHTVADLDATVALLSGHLGPVKDAVQAGRRIVTLRHKELDISVATAFMSAEPTG